MFAVLFLSLLLFCTFRVHAFLEFNKRELQFLNGEVLDTFTVRFNQSLPGKCSVYVESDNHYFDKCTLEFNSTNFNVAQPIQVIPLPFAKELTADINVPIKFRTYCTFLSTIHNSSFEIISKRSKKSSLTSLITGSNFIIPAELILIRYKIIGYFQLVKSPFLTIQAQHRLINNNASVIDKIAVRYGDDVFVIDSTIADKQKAVQVITSLKRVTISYTSSTEFQSLLIHLACGSEIKVNFYTSGSFTFLHVDLKLAPYLHSQVRGLIGNMEADATRRFQLPDGTVISVDELTNNPASQSRFFEAWRVPANDLIFVCSLCSEFVSAAINFLPGRCVIPPVPFMPTATSTVTTSLTSTTTSTFTQVTVTTLTNTAVVTTTATLTSTATATTTTTATSVATITSVVNSTTIFTSLATVTSTNTVTSTVTNSLNQTNTVTQTTVLTSTFNTTLTQTTQVPTTFTTTTTITPNVTLTSTTRSGDSVAVAPTSMTLSTFTTTSITTTTSISVSTVTKTITSTGSTVFAPSATQIIVIPKISIQVHLPQGYIPIVHLNRYDSSGSKSSFDPFIPNLSSLGNLRELLNGCALKIPQINGSKTNSSLFVKSCEQDIMNRFNPDLTYLMYQLAYSTIAADSIKSLVKDSDFQVASKALEAAKENNFLQFQCNSDCSICSEQGCIKCKNPDGMESISGVCKPKMLIRYEKDSFTPPSTKTRLDSNLLSALQLSSNQTNPLVRSQPSFLDRLKDVLSGALDKETNDVFNKFINSAIPKYSSGALIVILSLIPALLL